MGPKGETMDVESLQKVGTRRGPWLDCCLLLSVIVLFAAVSALVATGILVVRDLQSKLHPEFEIKAMKMQNYAYLKATSSKLQNQTMTWTGDGKSVESNYEFNSEHHSLHVKQAGSYFLFVEFNVTCTFQCQPGVFRVQVADKLSCEVRLPNSTDSPHVNRKCWTVSQLRADTHLLFQMTVPRSPLQHWKLELRGSGFGLFQVD